MTTANPTLSPALIVGTGLVGASVGCALTKAGVLVHLRDAVPSHAQVAASRGAGVVDEADPSQVRLVVVAVPPDSLADVIEQSLAGYPGATVTDVGSVKGTVLARLRASGADLSRYVGSHPMAGSQLSGPLGARAELFVDRTWVVTPHDTAAAHAVLAVNELVRLCGGRAVAMGAAHHDEAVAQVSHLPQLVSALMAGSLTQVPDEHLRLAGQGLRDVTRIAGSDPQLWQQIIGANKAAVARELAALSRDLQELVAKFDDAGELAEFLGRGQAGRRALPGKHGAPASSFARVVVEIPDAPGALARLFADIEGAGVNVEDLSIDHDINREVGYLSVQVDPGRVEDLGNAMSSAGWTLRDPEQGL
ncbi:MAG: prephenate dehydrogenase [Propionibacteriaceae bacterium]|jgi:prephenate dehydrogenase|nr:prephenate dehydrogenase [Propionibacteriaceae bacterium]